MLKKLIWGVALICAATGVRAQRQVMLDKVVAVVGNSSILYSEVADYGRRLVEQRRAAGYTTDRDPMNEALEGLMMQKLLFHQAQIDSVEIDLSGIQGRVEEQLQLMIDQEGSIPALEAKYHMAIFNIREQLRQNYQEQSYAQAMQNQVTSKVTIVPGEVERFYKKTSRDSLPVIPDQYVYAQITKFPKTIVEAKRRTRERLLELRNRVMSGDAKFETLARMYSVDGSAMRGGEIEPSPLAGLFQVYADALAELKPGQISEVVESQAGFHIIQLIDKRGNLYHSRHILLRPTYTFDELSESLRELDSLADLIRKDSITFEKAAQLHSDDALTKMNGGLMTNHDILERADAMDVNYTQTKFLKEDFANDGFHKPYVDYLALSRLKPGEVSDAYQAEDVMGNQLSKIVKLVEIVPAHKASLENDYIRLEELALNIKREKEFEAWLDRKIAGMYVFIDPEFRDGEFENKNWVK
ncbi:peptidylprolyl isomerase [uncultured Alistipes sp.]|uniref:peptidylprolyl isomerase n=1 Tax=uncultured Alistipes sp. TaxID=538949 RepID=UPI0025CCD21C|nr:peptidylprolyl isomerase [uncultured Alistipes sp.]